MNSSSSPSFTSSSSSSDICGEDDGMFYPLLFSHTLQTNFKYEHAIKYIEAIKQVFHHQQQDPSILIITSFNTSSSSFNDDFIFLQLNLTTQQLMQALLQNQSHLRFLNSIIFYLFKYEYQSSIPRIIYYLSSLQSTLEQRKHTSCDYTFIGQKYRANYQNAKAKYFYELAYEVDPLNFLLYLYLANVSRATDCVIYQKRYLELGIFKIKQELNFLEHYKQIHRIQTKKKSMSVGVGSGSNISVGVGVGSGNSTSSIITTTTSNTHRDEKNEKDEKNDDNNTCRDSNKYHLMEFIIEYYEHQLIEYYHVLNLNRYVNDKSSLVLFTTDSDTSANTNTSTTTSSTTSSTTSTPLDSSRTRNTITTTTLSQIDQMTQTLIDHSPQSFLAWFYHAFYYGFEYSEMYSHVHDGAELDVVEFEQSCRKALRSFRVSSSLLHYPYTEIYFPLILENMGMIYENLRLYEKALKYFHAACHIGTQLDCYWSFLSRMTLYLYRLENRNEEACLDGLVLLQHCMLRNPNDPIPHDSGSTKKESISSPTLSIMKDGLDMSFVCMHLIRIAETFLDGNSVRQPTSSFISTLSSSSSSSSTTTTSTITTTTTTTTNNNNNNNTLLPFDLNQVEPILSSLPKHVIEKDEDVLIKKFPSLMIQSQQIHHYKLSPRVLNFTLNDIIHLLMQCDGHLYSVRARWFEKQYIKSGHPHRFYALTLQERLEMLRECIHIDSLELEWFIEMDTGLEGFFDPLPPPIGHNTSPPIKKEFKYLWYHRDSTERSH